MKKQLKKAQLKINNKPFPVFGYNSTNEANIISQRAKELKKNYWSLMPNVIRAGNKAWSKHLSYLRRKGIKVVSYGV